MVDWIGRHLDYDGEETWLVESHGPPEDPTPPCRPPCKHCYAVQLPPDAEEVLKAVHPLSLYPSDIVNHPRLEDVLREAERIVSTREPLPLKVITSLKGADPDTVETMARYVDQIDVHVMSTNPKVRASLSGETLRTAEKALEALLKVPEVADPVANVVIVPGHNLRDLTNTLNDLDEAGFRKCVVIPVGVTDYNPFDVRPLSDEETEFLRRVVETANETLDMDVIPCDSLRDPSEFMGTVDRVASRLAELADEHGLSVGLVTGEAFGTVVKRLASEADARCERGRVEPIVVRNRYFGGNISCAGLLTGRDVLKELEGKNLDVVVIPEVSVESGTFIDGVSPLEIAVRCDCEVTVASDLEDIPASLEALLEGPEGFSHCLTW